MSHESRAVSPTAGATSAPAVWTQPEAKPQERANAIIEEAIRCGILSSSLPIAARLLLRRVIGDAQTAERDAVMAELEVEGLKRCAAGCSCVDSREGRGLLTDRDFLFMVDGALYCDRECWERSLTHAA